jgi:hypothetical protein
MDLTARARKRAARTAALILPRDSGEGGPPEGWWKGRLTKSFVAVAEGSNNVKINASRSALAQPYRRGPSHRTSCGPPSPLSRGGMNRSARESLKLSMEEIVRKARPKLTAALYAERFEAEAVLQQRRYCDAFALWQSCGQKPCRRDRACRGDQADCLRSAIDTVPRDLQRHAREDILAATPANIGGPERRARLCLPHDFYDGGADRDAIAEMKRLRKTGTIIQGGDNAHTLRLRLVDAGR